MIKCKQCGNEYKESSSNAQSIETNGMCLECFYEEVRENGKMD